MTSVQSSDTHFDPHPVGVFMEPLGKNSTNGEDYWYSFRSGGDKMSNDLIFVGTVQEGLVTLWAGVPLEVAEHLQTCLDAAYTAYGAEWDLSMHGGVEADEARVSFGPMAFLPNEYSHMFTAWTAGKNTGEETKVNRYFIRWSRKEVDQWVKRADAGDSRVTSV